MHFASNFWGLFKALIACSLNEIAHLSRAEKLDILDKIEQLVVDFFTQVIKLVALPYLRGIGVNKSSF